MAGGAFQMQNQLQFNLGIPLAASNLAVRYHKPNPIMVERAGGVVNIPHHTEAAPASLANMSARSSVMEDKMALAVRLAQRDMKKQKDTGVNISARSRTPSPKRTRSKVTKGGTRMVYTREAQERAARLQTKRQTMGAMRAREQGWNSGTAGNARTQTPPRDKQARLPATTDSPPTRDTDRYPPVARTGALDDPTQEIDRLQREMEGYLQQIQVIEQRAMKEDPTDLAAPKTRRREGYLDADEDPTRRTLRQEEQTVRAGRQLYNLRQQIRTLQEHVSRAQGRKVKHTKKSQVMLRLAAAHRGAVRAIQSFVNQTLPDTDLRGRGLPQGYGELAGMIRQLAVINTQIREERDTKPAHEDLIKMLDRVDELNTAWCEEVAVRTRQEAEAEVQQRRRKSPLARQMEQAQPIRGRQPGQQQRFAGKENRPKGLLKKQYNKPGTGGVQKAHKARQVTPERQRALQAGIEALMGGNQPGRQGPSSMAWDVSADVSGVSEPGHPSVILPKPLQHKRERIQKSVVLSVPESHFSDATLASCLKAVNPDDKLASQREPWKPGGSAAQSPSRRTKSQERARSQDRARSRERSRSRDQRRSEARSLDRSRSHSPRIPRSCLIQDMDEELLQELFPQGFDGQGRSRSNSPSPRSPTSRSRSPRHRSQSPKRYGQPTAYNIQNRLSRLDRGAEDERMIRERRNETTEISRRGMMEDQADIRGENVADLLMEDLMAEAANELTSLEQEDRVRKQGRKLQNNPTLENMYQRLQQMELESDDIRRRWGTIKFEEATSRPVRHLGGPSGPSGPVAMKITRKDASQSHRVQSSRGYDKDHDEPIIFTKSAPVVQYEQRRIPQDDLEDQRDDYDEYRLRVSHKMRLKVPDSLVKDVQSNLEKYQRHLKKTSHSAQGRFDPWKFVEEIADQVLDECLKEVDSELDEIGENIVHQLCKAEFSIPESRTPVQDVVDNVVDYESDGEESNLHASTTNIGADVVKEPFNTQIFSQPGTRQKEVSIAAPRKKEPEFDLESEPDRYVYSSIDVSQSEQTSINKSVDKTAPTASKKEVSFNQEISYEREAVFDAADLDTARDSYGDEGDENVEDFEDYEDEDDDDVEEVSPIDSDELEYSTDET